MRRFLALPIALLASGCTLRPWTPAVSVAYWGEDIPDKVQMGRPDAEGLVSKWALPADDPWSKYGKSTLLVAPLADNVVELPDVSQMSSVADANDAAAHLAATMLPSGVLWMADLRGAASVAFGATLSQRASLPISPVLTFNNWPDNDELIPAEETLAACVQYAPTIQPVGLGGSIERHPVFLLDSWRLAFREDHVDPAIYDNRYALTSADLPTPESLRNAGISRLVYVVDSLDDVESEEDDLHTTFLAYQASGIGIYFVDLEWLSALPPHADVNALLSTQRTWVEQRKTLFDSPRFYERSHAGFGGRYAHPIHLGGGAAFGGAVFGRGAFGGGHGGGGRGGNGG